MVETIAARKIKIHDLKAKFGLQQVENDSFFPEWFNHLPTLTNAEKQALDDNKIIANPGLEL